MELRLERRDDAGAACPYCREVVASAQRVSCACGVHYHAACLAELRGCVTVGCAAAPSTTALRPGKDGPPITRGDPPPDVRVSASTAAAAVAATFAVVFAIGYALGVHEGLLLFYAVTPLIVVATVALFVIGKLLGGLAEAARRRLTSRGSRPSGRS